MSTANPNGAVSVTLSPEQAQHVAHTLFIWLGGNLERFVDNVESREDIASVRALLDKYETRLEQVAYGEATADLVLTLPREEMRKLGSYLIEIDAVGADATPESIAYLRREIAQAEAGMAIIDQIVPVR